MNYASLIKKTGISMTYVAKLVGMSESLLRYHLKRKKLDPAIEKKLQRALTKITNELKKKLGL